MRAGLSAGSVVRTSIGIAAWAVLAGVMIWGLGRSEPSKPGPLRSALRFMTAEARVVEARMPAGVLVPGDRVLWMHGGRLRACGEVVAVERPVGGATVRVALYPDAGLPSPLPRGTTLTVLDPRDTLEWALGRVLSPGRRADLARQIGDLLSERREWLRATFGGLIEDLVEGAVADVATGLVDFVRSHEDSLRDLGGDLLAGARTRWEPILRDLVWPRVLDRLTPLAAAMGDDLWAALPWRDLAEAAAKAAGAAGINRALGIVGLDDYEVPGDQLVRWRDEFVRSAAVPIIERRLPDALGLVAGALLEASSDPRVPEALRASLIEDGLGNPRVMALLAEAFTAGVVANPRLRARLDRFLDDPRVHRALFDLAEQLEPRLMALAKSFLLDKDGERLHPELAMLVRVRVLLTELRWVLLEPGPVGPRVPGVGVERGLAIVPFGGSRTEAWERPLPAPAVRGAAGTGAP